MSGLSTMNLHRAVKVTIQVDQYETFYANRFIFNDADGNQFELAAFSNGAAIDVETLPARSFTKDAA